MCFKTLGLRPELVNGVAALGFEGPTPIQEQAIPTLLAGERDFIGIAQTGTGKTGAFGLPLIQLVAAADKTLQGIILCPTRELCLQITDDLQHFAEPLRQIAIVAVYGGAGILNQISQLKRGAQIVVATPGRLLDLIRRKAVSLGKIEYAVLDEADEMLNMGFQEDIQEILGKMPEQRKLWLFSATMAPGVRAIAGNYMTDPLEVSIGARNSSPKNIAHSCFLVQEKNRYQGLKRIIDFNPDIFGLVFCRTRRETQAIAELLTRDGYPAEALHGDLSQAQRDSVMRKFRQKGARILVATDVAARGLDVDDITHVIHYNLPDETDLYTHRSGRTARAGKSGASIALINMKEKFRIRALEKRWNIQFEFGKLPDGRAICEKKIVDAAQKLASATVNYEDIAAYLPAVYRALDGLDKNELIQRFVSAEFSGFIDYYRQAGDINVKAETESRPVVKSKPAKFGEKRQRFQGKDTQRFLINVGHADRVNKGAIVRMICDQCGIQSSMIGAIDLNPEFSFFEIEAIAAAQVFKTIKKARLDGRPVQVSKVKA